MKLDDRVMDKRSYMGACLTLIIALTTLLFFYTKTITIIEKHDVDIMSALVDNAIDFNYKFSANDGFFISAALTRYNSNMTLTEDPKYGEIIFEHFGWGNSNLSTDRRILDSHFCTDEELGL